MVGHRQQPDYPHRGFPFPPFRAAGRQRARLHRRRYSHHRHNSRNPSRTGRKRHPTEPFRYGRRPFPTTDRRKTLTPPTRERFYLLYHSQLFCALKNKNYLWQTFWDDRTERYGNSERAKQIKQKNINHQTFQQ